MTAADIVLAAREGYAVPEHLKRYTTLGMGTDQGKTGNLAGLALLAAATGQSLAATAPTTFRPPYTPVSYGLLAGRERGRLADPVRVTPMHDWHVAAGAVFEDVGQWKRARYYPRPGEDMAAAVRRECLAARDRVALLDASTLGKIEVSGPDAARFLDRIYINRWDNLAVGACRYGVMCREDGMVFDDGVGTRLAAGPLPADDHDRQCRGRARLARGMAADRVDRSRRVLHVGDRGMGQRDAGRTARPRRAAGAGA